MEFVCIVRVAGCWINDFEVWERPLGVHRSHPKYVPWMKLEFSSENELAQRRVVLLMKWYYHYPCRNEWRQGSALTLLWNWALTYLQSHCFLVARCGFAWNWPLTVMPLASPEQCMSGPVGANTLCGPASSFGRNSWDVNGICVEKKSNVLRFISVLY